MTGFIGNNKKEHSENYLDESTNVSRIRIWLYLENLVYLFWEAFLNLKWYVGYYSSMGKLVWLMLLPKQRLWNNRNSACLKTLVRILVTRFFKSL